MDQLACPICRWKAEDETALCVHVLQLHLNLPELDFPERRKFLTGGERQCFCREFDFDDHNGWTWGFNVNCGEKSKFVTHCHEHGGVVKHYLETLMGVD